MRIRFREARRLVRALWSAWRPASVKFAPTTRGEDVGAFAIEHRPPELLALSVQAANARRKSYGGRSVRCRTLEKVLVQPHLQ